MCEININKDLGLNCNTLLLIHSQTYINIIFSNYQFVQIKVIQPNSSSIEILKLKYLALFPTTRID